MQSNPGTKSAGRGEPVPRPPLSAGPASGPATVTAVVVARNEEANIAPCLRRLLWADRILLIDDGSTDGTVAAARAFTDWVVRGSREGGLDPVHQNLNRAFALVPDGWILQVDADERISRELAEEVRRAIREGSEMAYRVPFRTAVLGKWMDHGYWGRSTELIRLHRAGAARYPLRAVHEALEVDGRVGSLRSPIYHLPYASVSEFVRKTDLYTSREVERILQGTSPGLTGLGPRAAHPSAFRLFGSSLRIFLWSYWKLGGWKDGRRGMAASLLLAQYALLETLKVWERSENLTEPPELPEAAVPSGAATPPATPAAPKDEAN